MTFVLVTIVGLLLICALKICNTINVLQTRFEHEFVALNSEIVARHELIPRFLHAKKAHANPDGTLLDNILRARNLSMSAHQCVLSDPENGQNLKLLLGAETRLNHFLRELQRENPGSMKEKDELTCSFSESSKRYCRACQSFNEAVSDYNEAIREFPASLVAALFSYEKNLTFEPGIPLKSKPP